jgi:hypothetical protein
MITGRNGNKYWEGYSDGQAGNKKASADREYVEGYKLGVYDKTHGFDCRYD